MKYFTEIEIIFCHLRSTKSLYDDYLPADYDTALSIRKIFSPLKYFFTERVNLTIH